MTTSSKTIPNSAFGADANTAEDHLDVDAPIPGQQFVCLSFVSPEKILQQKEAYFRTAFWKYLKTNYDDIDFALVENFESMYDTFLDTDGQALEETFHEENQFQTTIRGIKVRGTYNTKHEADIRAKVLQKLDGSHHVFVAPIGYWLPWDPAEDAIQDQVYQEEQLNELMKNYKQNEMKRDEFYEQQKEERKKQAMEENKQRHQKALEDEDKTETGTGKSGGDGDAGGDSGVDKLMQDVESQAGHLDLKGEFEKFKGK